LEALLDGTPQFLVAAINSLVAGAIAPQLTHIDDLFRRQVVRPTVRARVQWNLLVTTWWLLVVTALVTTLRIIASGIVSDSKAHPFFINSDIGIVSLMSLAYLGIFITGILAWRVPWLSGPWQRQKRSEEQGG
jgi:hypothetical protein